jgi:hypothetical protein
MVTTIASNLAWTCTQIALRSAIENCKWITDAISVTSDLTGAQCAALLAHPAKCPEGWVAHPSRIASMFALDFPSAAPTDQNTD